jgi:hypothetical protein
MKNKYGLTAICAHCGNVFLSKPRFLEYCSTPCKNPINRKGNIPWNKGMEMTVEQKSKLNTDGLKIGRGWNKGISNLAQKEKWTGSSNPNWEGKLNNQRPKKQIDDELAKYKGECRKATYRTLYRLRKQNLIPKTGKKKTDIQVDHIIPFKQGYDLKISPMIIGHQCNLQFITGEENRKKWDSFQSEEIVNKILENFDGIFR